MQTPPGPKQEFADEIQGKPWASRRTLIILALCFLFVSEAVVIAVLFRNFNTPTFFYERGKLEIDFLSLYGAATLSVSQWRTHIYDTAVQFAWICHILSPEIPELVLVMQYPPYTWLLLTPLALLPLKLSFIAWTIFSLVVGLGCLALILADTQKYSRLIITLFLALTLVSLPTNYCLRVGQLTFVLVALISWLYYSWKVNRSALIGFAMAVLSLKPQIAILWMPGLIAQRKWTALAWFILLECLLLVGAGLVFGWNNLTGYPGFLARIETTPDPHLITVSPRNMASLRGLLSWLMPSSIAFRICLIAFLGILPVLYWLWRKVDGKTRLTAAWMFALTIVSYLALSPHLHSYDCLLLSLAAALSLPRLVNRQSPLSKSPSLYLWTIILVSYPAVSWLLAFIPWSPAPGRQLPLFFLPNLLLFALCLSHCIKLACSRPSDQPETSAAA